MMYPRQTGNTSNNAWNLIHNRFYQQVIAGREGEEENAIQTHTRVTLPILFCYTDLSYRGRLENSFLVEAADKSKLLWGHLCCQHSNLHLHSTYFRGPPVQETAGSLATDAGAQQGSSLHLGSWYWQQKSFADASPASTLRLASITNTC